MRPLTTPSTPPHSLDEGCADPFDVNADGLIDVVRTTGTEMQTWLNPGWLPNGEGRFGSATFSGGSWQLSTAPIESCLLYDGPGSPVDFADSEVRLADMNGDVTRELQAAKTSS